MKITTIILILPLLFGYSCIKGTGKNIDSKKPNILFIFTDDQRADALGCAGNTYIKTPNIDRLAEKGVQFPNTYVMGGHHGAICAPSRAMLMSGKSLFHVYDKLEGVTTMPAWLSQHGYQTFGTGKWHNEPSSFENSFQKGENVFLGGMCDHFNVPCRTLENGRLSEPVTKGYSTDLFAGAAISFIEGYSKGPRENPFFCYVSFTAPHDPRSPHENYTGMYADEAMPLPGNFKPLHPFQFDDMNIRDETLAPWPRTPEIIRASLADYYALISHVDHQVGELIATLEKNDLLGNTIIIYAADNGLAIGSHGLLGKQNLYEHSTRVPFIISGPGIPAMENPEALVYLYDIFPTLCNLIGIPVPEGVDGQNLYPVMQREAGQVRSSLYTAYRNSVRAVRTSEWKLIGYPQHNHYQLFNLADDPLELNNLAYDTAYKETLNNMNRLLSEWHQATDDTATMNPAAYRPLDYDWKQLRQVPDRHQPEYVLEKYFPD